MRLAFIRFIISNVASSCTIVYAAEIDLPAIYPVFTNACTFYCSENRTQSKHIFYFSKITISRFINILVKATIVVQNFPSNPLPYLSFGHSVGDPDFSLLSSLKRYAPYQPKDPTSLQYVRIYFVPQRTLHARSSPLVCPIRTQSSVSGNILC